MKLSKELGYWRADRPDEWKMDEFIRKATELEKENAAIFSERAELIRQKFHLKSQLENVKLGLVKMDKMCLSLKFGIDCDHEGWWLEDKPNCNIIIEAPTLADLVDAVALKEVE